MPGALLATDLLHHFYLLYRFAPGPFGLRARMGMKATITLPPPFRGPLIPNTKMAAAPGVVPFLRGRRYRRTADLDYAPGPCKNREPEVVQLYNGGHEVQAETQA
jgi:hypothetical protein